MVNRFGSTINEHPNHFESSRSRSLAGNFGWNKESKTRSYQCSIYFKLSVWTFKNGFEDYRVMKDWVVWIDEIGMEDCHAFVVSRCVGILGTATLAMNKGK